MAVLIEATVETRRGLQHSKPNHYKKFTGSVYDFFTGEKATTSDVYLLPNLDVFVDAHPECSCFPISKLKFYKGT